MNSTFSRQVTALIAFLAIIFCIAPTESKLFSRQRYYEDSLGGYDSPYATGSTGERAILTVRGTRNPYDGSAPSKLIIEDNPYRGPYPRGVYDRLDAGYNRRQRMPYYPNQDFGYGGYNSGYNSMFGAPNRIAVTGAFPYGYGSRFV